VQTSYKEIANLNEAVKIAEERTEKAVAEREKIEEKNREYIHKLQSMKEDIQEKEFQI
jgi:hypothetical protein